MINRKIENLEAMQDVARKIIDVNGIEIAVYLERELRSMVKNVNYFDIRDGIFMKYTQDPRVNSILNIVYEDIKNNTNISPTYKYSFTLLSNVLQNFNIALLLSEEPVHLTTYRASKICTVNTIMSSEVEDTAIVILRGGDLYTDGVFKMLFIEILKLIYDKLICVESITEEDYTTVVEYIYALASSRVVLCRDVGGTDISENIVATEINSIGPRLAYKLACDISDARYLIDLFKPVNDELSDIPESDAIDSMYYCKELFSDTLITRIESLYNNDDFSNNNLPYVRRRKCNTEQSVPPLNWDSTEF